MPTISAPTDSVSSRTCRFIEPSPQESPYRCVLPPPLFAVRKRNGSSARVSSTETLRLSTRCPCYVVAPPTDGQYPLGRLANGGEECPSGERSTCGSARRRRGSRR